jgi:hypothetical protein
MQEQSVNEWKCLFEAVLVERDPLRLAERLQNASGAIVDRLNEPHTLSERGNLVIALRTIADLEKLSQAVNLGHS